MQVHTGGQTFREAWIAGVKKHYPGTPKPSYISPWADMPNWEQQSATAVYDQVRHFIATSGGAASRLTRAQKGRFVALCWIAQIFKHVPDPEAGLTWPTGTSFPTGSARPTPTSSSASSWTRTD